MFKFIERKNKFSDITRIFWNIIVRVGTNNGNFAEDKKIF